ncbi:MAG: hypothetical protein P8013_01420 [Candidatus Sulfobium sp.]
MKDIIGRPIGRMIWMLPVRTTAPGCTNTGTNQDSIRRGMRGLCAEGSVRP